MESSELNVSGEASASFISKTLVLIALWVSVSIAGLSYYIFYQDMKQDGFYESVFAIESSLVALDVSVLEADETGYSYSEKLTELEVLITEGVAELDKQYDLASTQDAQNKIPLSFPLLSPTTVSEYRRSIADIRSYLFSARKSFDWRYYVDLELLKRLLIGFGVFTVVFVLLVISGARKRAKYGITGQRAGDDQGYQQLLQDVDEASGFYSRIFLYSSFQRMHEPCLLLNRDRAVKYANQSFAKTWEEYADQVKMFFSIEESSVVELKKLVIPSAEKIQEKGHVLTLGGKVYSFLEEAIWDGSSIIGYELKLCLESDALEYEVLSKSVELMSQDVWNVPVRILRDGSPVGALAQELESTRQNVIRFFDEINALSEASSLVQVKKLHQVFSLLQDIKAGNFDFSLNHNDVIKLADHTSEKLEQASEEEVFDIASIVEDLHHHCDEIFNTKENDSSKSLQVTTAWRSAQDILSSFSSDALGLNEAFYEKLEANLAVLDNTLLSLNGAKEVTLNAMAEGTYEDDELDLKQFFIEDVGREMESVISKVEKSLIGGRAIVETYESNLQLLRERLSDAVSYFEKVPETAMKTGELLDRVAFLMHGLSSLDSRIQAIQEGSKQQEVRSEIGEDENGDW